MFPLIATIVTIVVLTGSTIYSTYQKTEKIKSTIQTSKSLMTAQKASTISNLKSPKLSDLVQNSLTDTQKVELNNLQQAVNTAVIKDNIQNPSCNDLAKTGYITLEQCNTIKNEKNDFATVNKGEMQLDNPTQSQIINNVVAFKQNVKNGNTITIKPYNKRYMSYKLTVVKKNKNKRIKKIKNIASSNNIVMIQNYAKATINKANSDQNSIKRKLQILSILSTQSNRIKQIKYHSIHKQQVKREKSNKPSRYQYTTYIPSKTFVNQYINHEQVDLSQTTSKDKTTAKNVNAVIINSPSQLNERINNFANIFH